MAYLRLDRYREKLRKLEQKRNAFMRAGKYASMLALEADIEEAKRLVKEAEEYEARPLKELVSEEQLEESGIIPLLIECHLAADFLYDCTFELKNSIVGLGLEAVTIVPELNDLTKKANAFASRLIGKDNLESVLLDNETLLEALHKKTLSYIAQRLKKGRTSKKTAKAKDNKT